MTDGVDYTGQGKPTPPGPEGDDVDVDHMLATLKREFPYYWVWTNPQAYKRMRDEMRMAASGQDTTADEDARLKQGRKEGMNQFPSEKPVPAAQSGAAPGDRRSQRSMKTHNDLFDEGAEMYKSAHRKL